MRRILVLVSTLCLVGTLTAPVAALAAPGKTILVDPPSGGDDTAAVQAALNRCVGAGPGCVVKLQLGTYHTSQLATTDFRGALRGMGANRTTLASLPHLTVNLGETGDCTAGEPVDGGVCAYPNYVNFSDGIVEVSDLTIDTSASTTNPWMGDIDLVAALNFDDATRIRASVDGVAVRGGMDPNADHTGGIFGSDFNTFLGVNYYGHPDAAGGSFAVRDSLVRTVAQGITPGPVINGRVVIEGNSISNVFEGIVMNGPSGTFEVSNNRVAADNLDRAEWNHFGIVASPSGAETGVGSRFSIHDNAISVADTCGCGMTGIVLADAVGGTHWFTATVAGNSVSLPTTLALLPDEFKEGISLNNTIGSTVTGNTVTSKSAGSADAIGIWGYLWGGGTPAAARNTVAGNDVRGFTSAGQLVAPDWDFFPGLGYSKYYLDSYTASNLVVCTSRRDTFIDGGTGNRFVSCAPVAPPAARQTPSGALRAVPACRTETPAKLKPSK